MIFFFNMIYRENGKKNHHVLVAHDGDIVEVQTGLDFIQTIFKLFTLRKDSADSIQR